MEAIDAMLADGTAQFWCDGEAALVTRILEFPGGAKVLDAIAGAGDMNALSEKIEPACTAFGQAMRLSHLFVTGRHGWKKVLGPHGWKFHQSILTKELH